MPKRKIYVFNEHGTFKGTTSNASELARKLKVNKSEISNCLNNRQKTVKKHFFCQPLDDVSELGLEQLEILARIWKEAQGNCFDLFVKVVSDLD